MDRKEMSNEDILEEFYFRDLRMPKGLSEISFG